MSPFFVEVNCPYCGRKVTRCVSPDDPQNSTIQTCELEDGGCEGRFVMDVQFHAEAHAHMIEGESQAVELSKQIAAAVEDDEPDSLAETIRKNADAARYTGA